MRRLIIMLVNVVVCVFPAFGYAQVAQPEFQTYFLTEILSHSTGEATELQVAMGAIPGDTDESHIYVTHGFELHTAGGDLLGEVMIDVSANGLAKLNIVVGPHTSSGEASLIVDGQEFCCVPVDDNRVAYRVNIRRSSIGRNPFIGEPIPIPASVSSIISGTVFDLTTGATRSTEPWRFRPVVRVVVGAD